MRAEEWLIDVLVDDVTALSDAAVVERCAVAIAESCGLTVLGAPLTHRFPDTAAGPGGATSLLLLSESHLAIHTWPERSAALVSLGTCRLQPNGDAMEALIRQHLGATTLRTRRLDRFIGPEPLAGSDGAHGADGADGADSTVQRSPQ